MICRLIHCHDQTLNRWKRNYENVLRDFTSVMLERSSYQDIITSGTMTKRVYQYNVLNPTKYGYYPFTSSELRKDFNNIFTFLNKKENFRRYTTFYYVECASQYYILQHNTPSPAGFDDLCIVIDPVTKDNILNTMTVALVHSA